MRVSWSAYGSRGDVEPMTGLALQLQALGAEVRVCAPPDFAELLAGVGVPVAAGRLADTRAGAGGHRQGAEDPARDGGRVDRHDV